MFDRIRWFFQRVSRGYDDPSWWDIEISLARWIMPRLSALICNGVSHPPELSAEKWDEILNKIFKAFYLIVEMQGEDTSVPPIRDEIDEGLDLLRRWYFHLWD